MSQNPVIPDEVQEEIDESVTEENLIGGYLSESGDNEEKLGIVENWFPGKDEWHGKTNISPKQARAVAIAKHLPTIFHEIEEYDEFLELMIDDYMKLLTSVEGVSRNEQMKVLQSLFSGVADEEQEAESFVRSMIAAREASENE